MGSKERSIVVLTPNGRRQTLKVNLDSSILQILEEVCTKHGFNCDEFALRHHNTILDPTSVIRYSGLPNNAFLEMVQSKRPSISQGNVTLSLQIDGYSERLSDEFLSNSSLEYILKKLAPNVIEDTKKIPVVVYMRREVVGLDAIKNTTLRSLGLTSGRALLRVTTRDHEEHPDLQCSGILMLNKSCDKKLKHVKEEFLLRRSDTGSTTSRTSESGPYKIQTFKSDNVPAAQIVTAGELVSGVVDSARSSILSYNLSKGSEDSIEFENIKDEKPLSSGLPTPKKPLSPVPMDISNADQSRTKQEKKELNVDDFKYLDERNGLVFPLEVNNSSIDQELPDSFFDVTVDDVKFLMRDLRRSREDSENAPLQTEALRKKAVENKIKQYSKTIIRVQFPDRLTIQGVFSPNETVNDINKFIKNYLHEPNSEFYLYTSPPKRVLPENSSLTEVGCVPCAKIYFAFVDQNLKREQYLHDKVMPYLVSQNIASFAAIQLRGKSIQVDNANLSPETPRKMESDLNNKPRVSFYDGASTSENLSQSSSKRLYDPDKKNSEGKVPKWFKP